MTINYFNDEELFLKKRIEDILEYSEKNYVNKFTAFLTEREQEIAMQVIAKIVKSNVEHILYGGYEDAERKILGILPGKSIQDFQTNEAIREFPVTTVTFTYSSFFEKDKLTHRDFLGAIMNCGIKHETIGDILTGNGYAIVFCMENAAKIILEEVKRIGKTGVKSKIGMPSDYPIPEPEYTIISDTVNSMRLDSIVSVATRLSRVKSLEMISNGYVKIKGFDMCESSHKIKEETAFTVKGYGKFLLAEIGNVSKKGRTHIKIKKFK